MKRLYTIVAVLALLLGLIHVGFTPVFYPAFGLPALWFAGTGLALVFLATTNLAVLGRADGTGRGLAGAANVAGLILFTWIAVTLQAPQGYLGCLLVLGMLVLGTLKRG